GGILTFVVFFQEELRTGERAVVRFRFLKHSEYLRVGAKLLFREGVTKGIGHVTRLVALSPGEDGSSRLHQEFTDRSVITGGGAVQRRPEDRDRVRTRTRTGPRLNRG
uniref:Translation elongation factor EFTu-like domain-containing protein n=1 Tax=Periophthalmus magnuspinnatus TaxID=409849 RepID=A0A3B4AUL8_9GOBI